MADVSALGFSIIVKDDKLFPQGFVIRQTGDQADPLDIQDVTVGEALVDANGNLVYAGAPSPIQFNIVLLPTTEEDDNMSRLFEAHRLVAGRTRTGGKMSVTVQYADGQTATANSVYFISGGVARSIGQPSRYKTKTYTMAAENIVRSA